VDALKLAADRHARLVRRVRYRPSCSSLCIPPIKTLPRPSPRLIPEARLRLARNPARLSHDLVVDVATGIDRRHPSLGLVTADGLHGRVARGLGRLSGLGWRR